MDNYEKELEWYRACAVKYENSKYRREREYSDYLKRWFGEDRCDGMPDCRTRISLRCTPMPFNIYFS